MFSGRKNKNGLFMKLAKNTNRMLCLLVWGTVARTFAGGLPQWHYLLPGHWPDHHLVYSAGISSFLPNDHAAAAGYLSGQKFAKDELNCRDSHCSSPDDHCYLLCDSVSASFSVPVHVVNEKKQPVIAVSHQGRAILAQVKKGRLLVIDVTIAAPVEDSFTDYQLSLLTRPETGSFQLIPLDGLALGEERPGQPLPLKNKINWVANDEQGIFWVIEATAGKKLLMRLDLYMAYEILMYRYEKYLRWKRAVARYGYSGVQIPRAPVQAPLRKDKKSKNKSPVTPESPPTAESGLKNVEQPAKTHVVEIKERQRERKVPVKYKEMQESSRLEKKEKKL